MAHSRRLPDGSCSLYVIRVPLGNTAASTVYAVLRRKSLPSYVELFQAVNANCYSVELDMDPTTVVCDFEQGVIKALQTVLGPAITTQGCFYHLTQATRGKIQEISASMTYLSEKTPYGADELLRQDLCYRKLSTCSIRSRPDWHSGQEDSSTPPTHQLCGTSMGLLSLVNYAPTTCVMA